MERAASIQNGKLTAVQNGGAGEMSPLALHRDFANALIAGTELRAPCNGHHADANERRFCQLLTGGP